MIILESNLDEILNILQEECVEVVQAVCKIRRFGFDSHHPASVQNNREHLAEELGDLQCMIDLLKLEEFNMVSEEILSDHFYQIWKRT